MVKTSSRSIEHRGCQLTYKLRGEGLPLLFIQGVGLHGDGWQPQIAKLAEQYQCLSFDNRGIGDSQPAGVKLTVEQMAEDALMIIDHLGWRSAHIIGHSLGGLIAQHLALSYPQRVRSLSLLCTISRGSDATRLTGRMLWLGLRSHLGTRRMRRQAFLELVMPPQYLAKIDREHLADELKEIFGHDLAVQPPIVMKQLKALQSYDATPRLGELAKIPTLVVSARYDPIAPPEIGRALAKAIPLANYVEFEDASHGVVIQHAERINQLLSDHFQQAEGRVDERD